MSERNGRVVRAALYARVSSERQAQQGTIHSQLQMLRERISADGLTLDEEMCFIDDGYSGSTLVRPALERLRDQAAAGSFGRLYVHSPDRLARRYAHQALLVDELQGCGVDLTFLNHPLGQGPEENLLLQVQGVVAEYERAKIMERSRRGKLHAARNGRVSVLSSAPYGYRYVSREMGGGTARYDVHLPEAQVVRELFRWVGVERLTLSQTARRLGERGVLSPRGRSVWDHGTVWGILSNPAYKGMAAFGKRAAGPRLPRCRPPRHGAEQPRRSGGCRRTSPDQWTVIPVPAIVEEEMFEAVGEQLRENQRRHRLASGGAKYLLQGLTVCQGCGYAMCGARSPGGAGGKRLYYRCTGNVVHDTSGDRVCRSRSVHGENLEVAVWSDVRQLLSEPGRIEKEYERRMNLGTDGSESSERKRLQTMISSAQRRIGKLIDGYGDGLIEKKEFEQRIGGARAELARLEAEAGSRQKREAEVREMRLVIGQLEAFAERVGSGLENADWATRRELIATLVKRVEVGEKEVRVVYRVAGVPFDRAPSGGPVQDRWRRWDVPRCANRCMRRS